jgi:hypothetical protein
MTSDSVLRALRTLTLPSVLFASGLAGHAAAGGATPAASVLVPLFVLTVLMVAPFAGGAASPALSVALLAGGQGLLHAALQLLGGTGMATTTIGGAATAAATASASTGSHLMMHHGAAASHGFVLSRMSEGHLVMLLAHLAAVVVVGVWLAAGERAFLTLLALTARPVVDAWRTVMAAARRGVGALILSSPRLEPGWGQGCLLHRLVWTTGVVSRRGPPGTTSREPCAYAAVSTV